MKDTKRKELKFYIGAVGMAFFMIGDWLLDAAGKGDTEVGIIAHSNWPQMAMWRFVLSATLALLAMLPVFFASVEAIRMTRENEAMSESGASRFWSGAYCLGNILLISFGSGFHIMLCVFPMFYKTMLSLGISSDLAASAVNDSGALITIQLMIVYLICDLGVSIAWYYMIIRKKLNLSKWALICCPLSTLIIDVFLKMIPLQFFKDFTVAFESLGWLLMYIALAKHLKKQDCP
ncbi:DUF6796 family protein [Butyrivibrio sp. INlla21]|uniref:DUF6796 family protein n=1 Tax=Butyrivibrio sp. INlla21 TaxID=1520811 RepID=UPI0008F10DB6|nr:DUF6796 family protein [Butyrivibrio sp. INlla21]SFV02258.1 hypothetical protein SAMN02910342_03028 [Butyrivibrio sp. INlla21]